MYSLLVVDDKVEDVRELHSQLAPFFKVNVCSESSKILHYIEKIKPNAIILDILIKNKDGFSVLKEIQTLKTPPPVFIVSACYNPHCVVYSVELGANDFTERPVHPYMLQKRITRMIEAKGDKASGLTYNNDACSALLGHSSLIQEVREQVAAYAPLPHPVLILGESGTGKEMAAKLVHELSNRKGAYVSYNIGAMPESIAESLIFGNIKGSFTDARDSEGCIEQAHNGSLFLDEIADANYKAQTALLRVIEEKSVRRLGAKTSMPVDFKLICATNKDLEKAIASGAFREDLYYRMEALTIRMPPLRDHLEDIPELVADFLCRKYPQQQIEADSIDYLLEQEWAGNVRELYSALIRAIARAKGAPLRRCHFEDLSGSKGTSSNLNFDF